VSIVECGRAAVYGPVDVQLFDESDYVLPHGTVAWLVLEVCAVFRTRRDLRGRVKFLVCVLPVRRIRGRLARPCTQMYGHISWSYALWGWCCQQAYIYPARNRDRRGSALGCVQQSVAVPGADQPSSQVRGEFTDLGRSELEDAGRSGGQIRAGAAADDRRRGRERQEQRRAAELPPTESPRQT
jgi:hypothetical protein